MVESGVMDRKIPILFILPSLSRAGAETQLVNLVNLLDSDKFEKTLFTYLKNIDLCLRLNENDVSFYNQTMKSKYDISVIKKVSRIIDQKKIELIHCTLAHSLLVGMFARSISNNKPKVIAAIHTTISKSLKAEFYNRILYQWLLRACSSVLFVCKNQREYWIKKYPFLSRNSVVVYNGVDTEYFDPEKFKLEGQKLREELSIPDIASVICCIANFRPEKAHNILINAFERIDEKCFLLLAGDGETKPYIVELVHNKKLNDRVKFLGDMQDVRPVLAASNVSVLSSTAVETFSIAMLESMSMKVPVVATDIGGLSEAINPGETGYLVPIGNQEALSRALKEILHDRTRLSLMSKKCREIVLERFSQERMVESTLVILSELIKHRNLL